MNRRELIIMVAAIPLGAVAAARPATRLILDWTIEPLAPLNVYGGGFLVQRWQAEEIARVVAIPPELIGKGGR